MKVHFPFTEAARPVQGCGGLEPTGCGHKARGPNPSQDNNDDGYPINYIKYWVDDQLYLSRLRDS